MCYSASCLGYLLLAVIFGFTLLIYFSLRYRKNFLEKNLQITADQVWAGVAHRADHTNLKKSDLLFSIGQDGSFTKGVLVIKNANDVVVGRVECPLASREYKIWIGQDVYRINFRLSGWLRSAELNPASGQSVLGSFETLNILGKHKFNLPGYGTIISERQGLDWRFIFNYRLGTSLVGTTQILSSTRQIGKLVILPSEIPLHLRIFILAL